MNKSGYIRVAAAVPNVKPGDVEYNINRIKTMISEALEKRVRLIVFPELSITGYTCADLFYQSSLLNAAENGLKNIAEATSKGEILAVVGSPIRIEQRLFNCAVILANGKIIAIVPKTHLPNYNEFYEKRWFVSGSELSDSAKADNIDAPVLRDTVFSFNGVKFGIEICEDLWVPIPPSSYLCQNGADLIFNLSASDEQAGKHVYLRNLISQQSARCRCGYIYSSAGAGESSTDLAFCGNAIIAENGTLLGESERFSLSPTLLIRDIDVEILRNDRLKFSSFGERNRGNHIFLPVVEISDNVKEAPDYDFSDGLLHPVSKNPFTEGDPLRFKERCEEISSIQAWGLMQRLRSIGCRTAVIGISGGLDSTLALLVTVKAFDSLGLDRKGIIGITMPGFGTTSRTHSNAQELMELLGVTSIEIPIADAVNLHFRDIGQNPASHDATYENSQARERTQILMDMANKTGGIVIGTGDLSELALGWCTYNGDHMSMYGVNASIPKTLVKYLVKGYADSTDNKQVRKVLLDIIDTPISPELLPAASDDTIEQKTEDLVGPYILHDFFLYHMLRFALSPTKIYHLACMAFKDEFSEETIKHWLKTFYRRFFNQQFKRSCMPDGVKVGSVCLSPRGDWRMPSDASANLWLEEIAGL